MRLLVCFAFLLSLILCGCSSENVKTDPKNMTKPTSTYDARRSRVEQRSD
jgi:hypothetical protein